MSSIRDSIGYRNYYKNTVSRIFILRIWLVSKAKSRNPLDRVRLLPIILASSTLSPAICSQVTHEVEDSSTLVGRRHPIDSRHQDTEDI
jgi:hypothetical protein